MPRLRRWKKGKCSLLIPSQRLRAGLKYVAPPALEEATRKDTEKAATRLPHSERAQQCLPAAGGLRYVWRGGRARHSGCCPESSMPCPYADGSEGRSLPAARSLRA